MVSRWTSVCLSVRPSVDVRPSGFKFPGDNWSKHQWIFTKLGMCIDIVKIYLGIANGQISSSFTELSARHTTMAGYYSLTFLLFTEYKPMEHMQILMARYSPYFVFLNSEYEPVEHTKTPLV